MTENSVEKRKFKVIIIGGGMAGLSAAYHLVKNGLVDFKLLEARKRLGGRIVQIGIGKEKIELGANWIHGILGNPVYELALEHGLINIMQSHKPHKVVASTENGKQVPFAVLQEIYEAYMCFLKRCEEYFVTQYLPPDGIESVGDHIRLEISLYLDRYSDGVDRELRQLLFDCLLKRETCISGCHEMSEIDLLELGSYTELQGGNITLPDGYSSILEPIRSQIPPECLLLGCPISRIDWERENGDEDKSDSDKTVKEDEASSSNCNVHANVEVSCENGSKFYADSVICTVPLGVLKSHAKTMFHPPLPGYKQDAVDRLLFGTVDKILLEYDRPFLNPNITEILLLWQPTKSSKSTNYSNSWYKKIYSFSKVTETLLLGWISGKEAEYMESLSRDVVADVCTEILRKFLNDPFIPKPKTCVYTSWHSQPYSKGSYTAIAVGASQLDIECLAQPLYHHRNILEPIVIFAGEHTHSTFYSTVHGAYLSGRTAAQALLSHQHVSKRPSSVSTASSSGSTEGKYPTTTLSTDEIIIECEEEESDLSSWIQGINLN